MPRNHLGDEYIGDGVYVSFDGYNIWLRTEREGGAVHEIALDPPTYNALVRYRSDVYKRVNEILDKESESSS